MRRMISVIVVLGGVQFADAKEQPAFWAFSVDKLETRQLAGGDRSQAAEWSFIAGNDERRFILESSYEYDESDGEVEGFDSIVGLSVPMTSFYDGVIGVRLDTPDGQDQIHGYLGVRGLAQQFVEVSAGLSISDQPAMHVEWEYEGLLTNWITLTPSIELMIPLKDNQERGYGGLAPKAELGIRLSYDLKDRTFAPYIGIHQERLFGETASIARSQGKGTENFYSVVGVKVLF